MQQDMQTAPQGAGFLKVVGILMIIFGALSIVFSIIGIMGMMWANDLAGAVADLGGTDLGGSLLLANIAVWFALLGSVIQLVAGINGVRFAKLPEKAGACVKMGALVMVFHLLGIILGMIGGGGFNILTFLLGAALPVLFIIGGLKNKQA